MQLKLLLLAYWNANHLKWEKSLITAQWIWDRSIFLQNFQCTTMFISAFCKIWELNTECEIVLFWFSIWYNTGVISGSQMSSQLLQNTEIIKQTDFGKSEEKTDLSPIYSAVLLIQSGWNKDRIWINIFLEKNLYKMFIME